MITFFFLGSLAWLALFLEHALGLYGLLVAMLCISFSIQDERKKWVIVVHTSIVCMFADVMFGRVIGQSLVVYGVVLMMWSVAARFSRTRVFTFMALGMGSAFFLDPQRDHILRVMVVLACMWTMMRGVSMNTRSQEITLK